MLEKCDFGGRFENVNSVTISSEFQLLKYVTTMTILSSETKLRKKELYDLFVDQITQEIPVANSTLSPRGEFAFSGT